MISLLLAGVLSPFFLEVTPEVRTAYQSLGKIVEDRPMQITNVRLGFETGSFGRIGIRNWDVSSLTDRRSEVHRKVFYHTEFGPTWEYDWKFSEGWALKNDLTSSWTIYDGFYKSGGNKAFWFWQLDQSLKNPYIVPFWRIRRCVIGNDYLYCKLGLKKRFPLSSNLYLTPSAFLEGGSSRNNRRVFGKRPDGGGSPPTGLSTLSFRLEGGYAINESITAFAAVEEYIVISSVGRYCASNASEGSASHQELTIASVGLRFKF